MNNYDLDRLAGWMQTQLNRMVEHAFFGTPGAVVTQSKPHPTPTFETIIKAWEDALNAPPTVTMTPQLAKVLDDAVAQWVSEGTPREDIEAIMLIIPWKARSHQELETAYGPLHVYFTEHATASVLVPVRKLKWEYKPAFLWGVQS